MSIRLNVMLAAASPLLFASPAMAIQDGQSEYCASVAGSRCFTKYGYTSVECEEAEYWQCMSEPWNGGPGGYMRVRGGGE